MNRGYLTAYRVLDKANHKLLIYGWSVQTSTIGKFYFGSIWAFRIRWHIKCHPTIKLIILEEWGFTPHLMINIQTY